MAKIAQSQVFKTVSLQYPYTTADGVGLKELSIRRLTVGDMRQVTNQHTSAGDIEVTLFARMSGLVPEDIDQMDLADYEQLKMAYQDMTAGK